MTGPVNDPYERRLPDPKDWPSNRAAPSGSMEQPQRRVNELSWWLLGEQTAKNASAWADASQVADEAEAFLARVERRRIAKAEDWQAGEPGA